MIGKEIFHYKIIEKLGEGGMGVVYKAHDNAPLQIDDICNYATQIAEGMQAAHKKAIVHRDIKSSNIMITDEGQVKIMDFGLAKVLGGIQVTKVGTTLGTAAYMSPEQAQGAEIDSRTDIWSFGVILYEMLSGQLPFKGGYEQAVIYSILNEDPMSIMEFREDTPSQLTHIVEKAIQKNPKDRYQTTKDLIVELKALDKSESAIQENKVTTTIAVLPFTNMSADKEQEYFCDGIAEDIINDLTHLKDLHVIARTSSFAFKEKNQDIREIGMKLGAHTIVEGSVRKAGNRLRITAQLVNVTDGYHLWSERYDRELDSALAEAHSSRGLALAQNKQYKEAEKEFETAIQLNPKLFEAYYQYGRTCRAQGKHDQSANLFEKATKTRPENYQAALFLVSAYNDINLETETKKANQRALDVVRKHLDLNPDDARALYLGAGALIRADEPEEALLWVQRAVAIDPHDTAVLYNAACNYSLLGKIEEALEYFEKAMNSGFASREWIDNDSDLDPIRDHPRFQEALKKLKDSQSK